MYLLLDTWLFSVQSQVSHQSYTVSTSPRSRHPWSLNLDPRRYPAWLNLIEKTMVTRPYVRKYQQTSVWSGRTRDDLRLDNIVVQGVIETFTTANELELFDESTVDVRLPTVAEQLPAGCRKCATTIAQTLGVGNGLTDSFEATGAVDNKEPKRPRLVAAYEASRRDSCTARRWSLHRDRRRVGAIRGVGGQLTRTVRLLPAGTKHNV